MVELRMENKKFNVGNEEQLFVEDLQQFYINKRTIGEDLFVADLWMLLVPYSETLTGNLVETERENYIKKVENTKEFLKLALTRLVHRAKELDLLPSIEEQEAKIKRLDEKYPGRRPIREIYELL
jgi:hypothetical protein